jgi:formamidopyrimidine-DNA glycosylase
MPELPEVETIRGDLQQKIVGKKIHSVEVRKDKSVNFLTDSFVSALKGNSIQKIERRGKLMIFRLKTAKKVSAFKEPVKDILVHLKMTGQLIYEKKVKDKVEVVAGGHKLTEKDFDLPNSHTRIIFTFEDKSELFFNDLRRFGYMKLAGEAEVQKAIDSYGIEPLSKDFTFDNFEKALGKRKVSVKVALMDQPRIAGIGNIYADESCFCAKVLPTRPVTSLTSAEKRALFKCIPEVLKLSLKHRGTSFKDYLDSEGKKGNFKDFLKVYDNEGDKCQRCGGVIKKIKSNGRGTHFCPKCQH